MSKKIVKTYSGIKGRCMCGCSGKYSYTLFGARNHNPGYNVFDQVNERSVKVISGKVLRDPNRTVENDVVWVDQGNRTLAVYYA